MQKRKLLQFHRLVSVGLAMFFLMIFAMMYTGFSQVTDTEVWIRLSIGATLGVVLALFAYDSRVQTTRRLENHADVLALRHHIRRELIAALLWALPVSFCAAYLFDQNLGGLEHLSIIIGGCAFFGFASLVNVFDFRRDLWIHEILTSRVVQEGSE